MAKTSKPVQDVPPEPSGPEADERAETLPMPTHEKGQAVEERTIRLSVDLPEDLHFCLRGIAAEEGERLNEFAVRLLDQGRRRYASNAILQTAHDALRSKRRKTG